MTRITITGKILIIALLFLIAGIAVWLAKGRATWKITIFALLFLITVISVGRKGVIYEQ